MNKNLPSSPLASDVAAYILDLEDMGELDPNCKICITYFYPFARLGKSIVNVFAPRHKASPNCKSGKHAHCSCDICF